MAITKIHAIKHTLGKAINYICNDRKTNDSLIYTFNCSRETAELEFELTAQNARNGGQNQAYHLIQSFKPGEVTPEQAHLIAREWADKVLRGRHEYILATHTDKSHVHTHIIFNAVSFKDFRRYKSDKKSYYRLREISDEICERYGIASIEPEQRKRKFNYEKKYNGYISKKSLIRKAIDEAVLCSFTYEDFLNEMKRRGYIARENDFLWFRNKSDKRFSKTDTIGAAYRKENIQKRICGIYYPQNISLIIAVESSIKAQQSKSYEHWLKIQNLKAAAKTMVRMEELGIKTYDELNEQISKQETKIKSLTSDNGQAQKRIAEVEKIIRNNNIRKQYLPIIKEYNSAIFKNRYYENHRKEIDSYNKAVKFLIPHMISGKYPNPRNLESEKTKLQSDIQNRNFKIERARAAYDEYAVLKRNLDIMLDYEQAQPTQQEPHKRESIRAKLEEKKKLAAEQNRHTNKREHSYPEL